MHCLQCDTTLKYMKCGGVTADGWMSGKPNYQVAFFPPRVSTEGNMLHSLYPNKFLQVHKYAWSWTRWKTAHLMSWKAGTFPTKCFRACWSGPKQSSHPYVPKTLSLLFISTVRHAKDNSGRVEAHPLSCLPGPLNNEGHWEHHHQRGGEPERYLRELPDRVWRW